jgi:6-carboxyhexanoate--CoA ligase
MRATLNGKHVSGQERIVKREELEEVILELHNRPKGDWDFQTIKVEKLKEPPEVLGKALPIKEYKFSCVPLARNFIVGILETELGIRREITKPLLAKLGSGINNGSNLPGALLVDPESGEILNPDLQKGIRTILFDWSDREKIRKQLLERGFTERTLDALALATKNVYCGVEAEVCWSDDPDYVTGYVAGPKFGYIRISPLKEKGNPFGGRIYFVKKEKVERVIECLRKKAVLIREI